MAYGSSTEGGYGIGASTDHVDASHADRIDIPDAELLFRGHFARSGPDLVLTGQDGHRLVVTGYFTTEKHPDLVAPNGAHLTGDLVDLLAGSPTPGQYAQANTTLPPEAIGKVEKVVGHVTLIHNGVAGPLHVGDPVYKTDIVETAANSSCGIAFPDGTALDLVNNTRMALNEYNYEAEQRIERRDLQPGRGHLRLRRRTSRPYRRGHEDQHARRDDGHSRHCRPVP